MVRTTRGLYSSRNKTINMSENNGNGAMTKYAERTINVRVPIQAEEDLLKILEETTKRFGRKMSMADIEKVLETDRFIYS